MVTALIATHQPFDALYSHAAVHYNSNLSRKRRHLPEALGGETPWTHTGQMDDLPATIPRVRRDRMPGRVPGRPMGSTPRPRRRRHTNTPTFNSAADAAAAAVQNDGFKPREEKAWTDFHPTLDIDMRLPVFSAEEVDGRVLEDQPPSSDALESQAFADRSPPTGASTAPPLPIWTLQAMTPQRRRPGRPPRRPESMLSGLGSPPAQRPTPLPAQNPKERLTLPKPSFRKVDTFVAYEQDSKGNQVNYVDRTMAHVGFQEGELFLRPEKKLIRISENSYGDEQDSTILLESDGPDATTTTSGVVSRVEYDMDEQDEQWLLTHNVARKDEFGIDGIRPAVFEITMTQIEKEWHALEKRLPKPNPKPPQTQRPRSSSAAAVIGEPAAPGEEQDSKCAICEDGDCENANAIVFCDGCDLAVHQECYGVPYIPEGQWLCRKCQQIGRAIPTCVFCPNTEGAFKLTTESKWAHLLCAIWIPEVTLGNTTFMEPILEVANVPRSRWKLTCYICNQKMGACIQCGNKNCYLAFHVTCARRAKLYLKMKSTHFGPANFDASVLKALCDKHVPSEWRREHDTDAAFTETRRYYRREMKGRRWADSQASALALVAPQQFQPPEVLDDSIAQDDSQAGTPSNAQRRKRLQAQKNVWRLPSGAPVVPQVVLNAVINALTRFPMNKRKEFAVEACKYWTLKREARRGAALLKRLQLQMEVFSTTEITRRSFLAMGAAGGPRLSRRVAFAELLLKQMASLRELCNETREREKTKLQDAESLKTVVDTVYFPIPALLWPVLVKAQKLDTTGTFWHGFKQLQHRLELRYYTSVTAFSVDLGLIFRSVAGLDSIADAVEAHQQLAAASLRDDTLTPQQREVKKLAKRIAKAIQQPLREALRREAEVRGRPYEKELANLEYLLRSNIDTDLVMDFGSFQVANGDDVAREHTGDEKPSEQRHLKENGTGGSEHREADAMDVNVKDNDPVPAMLKSNGPLENKDASSQKAADRRPEPQQSPHIGRSVSVPRDPGGIPWYLEPFDVDGTSLQDERWTGRETLRDMSEALSDIDDDALKELGDDVQEPQGDVGSEDNRYTKPKPAVKKRRRQW